MGSFLNGKSVKEWQGAFDQLKEIPHGKVHEVLRIVIDGLEANERTIFLDIACFLNEYDKEEIIKSLNQCGLLANSGIEILTQKSLVYIDENNKIWMHDLLQEMGRQIVTQECSENPSKRSRIWRHEDALQVVKQNSGTDAIEAIKLGKVDVEDLILHANSFKKMRKLRLLIIADHVPHCGPAGHLSEKLRTRFARNGSIMFACWEALVKRISKLWLSCSNDSDGSKKQPQSSSTTGEAQCSTYVVGPDRHEVEQWAIVGQTNDVDGRKLRQEQRKQAASSVAE
ncbi:TMV resistance protein N-like [Syzygium oleosum]|uniref:TMV resistance protein N-like n=1 Tax=Syzygium oleosum TaxID=219896 RepID=UPI0024BB6169|nr:TMV resistance protein N-like [Syzygium oleosum]